MFSKLPSIQVPEVLAQLCCMNLKDTKRSYAEILDLVESDDFVKLLIAKSFDYEKFSGVPDLLNHMGWKFFRNNLASCYLYYAEFGKFPEKSSEEGVREIIEFERKFDSLIHSGNSRVFLLGFFLKICALHGSETSENKGPLIEDENKIKMILDLGKSKGEKPDWLIVMVLILCEHLGHSKLHQLIVTGKGALRSIFADFEDDNFNYLISGLLKYGHGISDKEFFLFNKV